MKIYSLLSICILLFFSCKQSSKKENTTPIDTTQVILSLVDSLTHIPLDSTAVQKQKDLISFFNEKYLLDVGNNTIDEDSKNINIDLTLDKKSKWMDINISLSKINTAIKRNDFESYFGKGITIITFKKNKSENPYVVELSNRSLLMLFETKDSLTGTDNITNIVIIKDNNSSL